MPAVGIYRRPAPKRLSILPRILPGRVESRADLAEQFFPRVGLRDKSAQTLCEHRTDFALLGETAAQNHVDVRVEPAQLVEDGVAIHDRKEEIEDDESNLL